MVAGPRLRWLPLLVLIAASAALHLAALRAQGDGLDPDEAVVALMGKHILRGISLPAFYYGQPYLGSLEAYAVAAAWAVDGMSLQTARLVPLVASLGLVVAVYALALGRGRLAATAAALPSALPPPDVLLWHVKIRGGFMIAALLAALVLLLATRLIARPAPAVLALLLGLLAGLTAWTNQLALPFVAAAVTLVILLPLAGESRRRRLLTAGLVIGALPLILYNLVHPGRTFFHLAGHYLSLEPGAGVAGSLGRTLSEAAGRNAAQLLGDTAPRLAGGATHLGGALRWLPALALAATLIAVLAATLARAARDRLSPRRLDLAEALLAAAVLLGLVLRRNAELNQFLHVWPLVPLAIIVLAPPRRRVLACAFVTAAAGVGLVESLATLRDGSFPAPQPPRALLATLKDHAIDRVYTEHRPAYLVDFYSDERIIASPRADFAWPNDRWPPYTAVVDAAASPAWLFERGSPNARTFVARCTAAGGNFAASEVDGYVIYEHATCPRETIFDPPR